MIYYQPIPAHRGTKHQDSIANEITKYNPNEVVVSGYTDSHGAADYNIALSQRRADAVSSVLNARGVANTMF